ncbi:ABC transporter permease [Zhihengliuella halotolerans]|uniref:Osmoprotectant transport system permease protein n=1 Tax=Zhihengliuella halotolerans TaxID=370736 RepID=A0A4V2GAC7_9MICC|nr:ABC transporter permease subunit [Zhihengliuella halotolerans]RZU63706.1 osmoprotectant transport system permease protein [Zhihengliuella halotolerans]
MNLLLDAAAWLADPAQWTGPGSVPTRILEHLWVTLLVVVAAAAVALPAGVWVGHTGRGRSVVIAFAGAARAIPTLGLLTLLGLWLGIGLGAPLLALIVLAIPSLLAGAYSGVESVDHTTTSAARALGMSEWQIVTRVELPLAAPVILGGVRAATLQVIATATLAAYLANTGLGRYLFNGLKSRDYAQMLAGALLVTLLALLLEIVLALLQRRAQRMARPAAERSQPSTPMVPTKGPS